MEGEYFERKDVIAFTRETRALNRAAAVESSWREALQRIARAQAILWSETPISRRQAILAQVDRELERTER